MEKRMECILARSRRDIDSTEMEKRMNCILQHIPPDIDSKAVINALTSENVEWRFSHSGVRSLAAVTLAHLGIKTPEVREKLSAVLLDEDKDRDEFGKNAINALRKLCGSAGKGLDVKTLTQDLQHENVQVRARAVGLLGLVEHSERIPAAVMALRHALDDSADEIRKLALEALGRLGEPATDALINWVQNGDNACSDDLYCETVDAIAAIGEPAVAKLMAIYEECVPRAREMILVSIRERHCPAANVVPFLIKALDDPSVRVRWQALWTLKAYGADATAALPRLVYALTNEYERYTGIKRTEYYTDEFAALPAFLREGADMEAISDIAEVLGVIGPDAYTALDVLMQLLENEENIKIRTAIFKAIGEIGPRMQAAIPQLMRLLENAKDIEIRKAAFEAICRIGPSEREYLKLTTSLTGPEPEPLELGGSSSFSLQDHCKLMAHLFGENRWSGIIEVMLANPLPKQILKRMVDFYLKAIIPDPRPAFCSSLAQAIQRMNACDCLPLVTEALVSSDDALVRRATSLIQEMGDLAVAAVPALVSIFDSTKPRACSTIISILARIGHPEAVLPIMIKALQHDDQDLREDTALAAGRMGIRSDELLPILRKGMTDWEEDARPSAAFALHKLDPTAVEALPLLEAYLDPENEWNFCALELLLEIGKPALPIIVNAFLNPNVSEFVYDYFMHHNEVRDFVTPEEFAPALLTFLNSEHADIRTQGAYLATLYPVRPENGPVIRRLWEFLFYEGESAQRYAAWALREITTHDS